MSSAEIAEKYKIVSYKTVTSSNSRLKELNYQIIRQKGSHVRLHHKTDKSKQPLTIPNHKTLGKGLLRKLLRDAELTIDDFLKLI